MKRRSRCLARSEAGLSAVEFATLAPVLIGFILLIAQLGILFFANAGLKSAVGEGARLATVYPRPSSQQIIARITDQRFGLDPAYLTTPTVTPGVLSGQEYLDIQVSHQVHFMFFSTQPLTLVERRRAFVHPVNTGV